MTVVSKSGMMFLKFLDDLELQREDEAELVWKSSSQPSNRSIAGAISPPSPTASPATNPNLRCTAC